ncbi:MAG TPA: pyroglutamyl-peptidase I [Hyphomicrobiaceae bacterium]|nr:pyroglutamyl-peptidase I [Hyphomicrobiaceae bacterium]
MTTAPPQRILITGFGPFPGVVINVSAQVAARLAQAARVRWPHHHVEACELPTQWSAGPHMLHQLWDRLRPDIALHFGVSGEARGLQLETLAQNCCRMDADAIGALPVRTERAVGGASVHRASLPFEAILRRLEVLRIPGCISQDAGAYLCNAILYDSIQRAAAARPVALAGFIHIPPELGGTPELTGPDGPQTAERLPSMLTIDEAVAGGVAILECTLEELAALRARASSAEWPQHR